MNAAALQQRLRTLGLEAQETADEGADEGREEEEAAQDGQDGAEESELSSLELLAREHPMVMTFDIARLASRSTTNLAKSSKSRLAANKDATMTSVLISGGMTADQAKDKHFLKILMKGLMEIVKAIKVNSSDLVTTESGGKTLLVTPEKEICLLHTEPAAEKFFQARPNRPKPKLKPKAGKKRKTTRR